MVAPKYALTLKFAHWGELERYPYGDSWNPLDRVQGLPPSRRTGLEEFAGIAVNPMSVSAFEAS